MAEAELVSKINEYLHQASISAVTWLSEMLPKVSDNWWQDCVMDKLSYNQRMIAEEKSASVLSDLDLAALLRVADRNWYAMRDFAFLPNKERDCIKEMMNVRNTWAHCPSTLPKKEDILHDLDVIADFLEQMSSECQTVDDVRLFALSVKQEELPNPDRENPIPAVTPAEASRKIQAMDTVYLVGQPDTKGLVMTVDQVGDSIKYTVFVNSGAHVFYSGQIALVEDTKTYSWIDLPTLQSYLSAFEINNPSSANLYSLNSARIDFVPYQFRPALKLIKSDEPRILIADSVGVGKTIEAGLIIKELEARGTLENVMIICPKPLVTERKWELEMKRFDEDFEPLTGAELRQIINDTDRDGEWPVQHTKTIVPYSILDSRTFNGSRTGWVDYVGLDKLDPAPHFDLVIVDEAHHIRNGSMDKEKAYAYKCVKYFCDHAEAVVMLTATPLQTSDDDLYTLLNVLRPDVVMDKASFTLMSKPNAYISKCAGIIRRAKENWQEDAAEALNGVISTQWGENVIAENPLFSHVLSQLEKPELTREERVSLISDVESLHSFNTMLNRTRRKDIQDFCIRRTHTLETEFTDRQRELHDELLNFERKALAQLHNERSVPFMISTIRRQAASCIFGLAPYLRDLINRRFTQIADDPELDMENFGFNDKSYSVLSALAQKVLNLADNLPEEDTKFDSMAQIIEQKQAEENNKIIIFSTYRYTLRYIKKKLLKKGYRVEQIDGGVKDEVRVDIRNRFELPRDDPQAFDILLFTEVGSEGLDYQFCNMMINYDLPWNPMRIEQRIGRIDRRGQKSEYVNIYNMITSDTVDADIYHRCLLRIGVFEKSIGECEEILGDIGHQIEKIALEPTLSDEERKMKLQQMADNEVRRVQALNCLEDEEKELFGFDLSNQVTTKEIQNAESPWISPRNLQNLIVMYLNDRIGQGNYILGESDAKTLRLSVSARNKLREDLSKLNGCSHALKRKWEVYLKGTIPTHAITFDPDYASKDRNAFFITSMHPLAKQAAAYYDVHTPTYVSIRYISDSFRKGEYAFSIYAWNYVGVKPHFRLTVVCENDDIANEFTDIIQSGSEGSTKIIGFESRWDELEKKQVALWEKERKANIDDAKLAASYKKETLQNNFTRQKHRLEQLIQDASEESYRKMKQGELENAKERFQDKMQEIDRQIEQSDIHTALIANGIICIE